MYRYIIILLFIAISLFTNLLTDNEFWSTATSVIALVVAAVLLIPLAISNNKNSNNK